MTDDRLRNAALEMGRTYGALAAAFGAEAFTTARAAHQAAIHEYGDAMQERNWPHPNRDPWGLGTSSSRRSPA